MKDISKFRKEFDTELTQETFKKWATLVLEGISRLFGWDDYNGMDLDNLDNWSLEDFEGHKFESARDFLLNLSNDYDWNEAYQKKRK